VEEKKEKVKTVRRANSASMGRGGTRGEDRRFREERGWERVGNGSGLGIVEWWGEEADFKTEGEAPRP